MPGAKMGKVEIDHSMTLDGSIAGPTSAKEEPPGEGGEVIFAW
jgi:hypothetical protein